MSHASTPELTATILQGPASQAPVDTYRLNADVFLVVQDGVARVLDFDRGRFYGLDAISTRMVMQTLDLGPEAAAAGIARRYGVDAARVRSDLDALLRDLTTKQVLVAPQRVNAIGRLLAGSRRFYGRALLLPVDVLLNLLVRRSRRLAAPGSAPVPGAWTVRLLLIAAWLSLRVLGWTGTLAWWRRWHRHGNAAPSATDGGAIVAVDQVVRAAAARNLLFPMVCKERALAGYQILRAFLGLPAELVVGFTRHPFLAHAWVTCGERYVTDDAAHCQLFSPVARYA
jgi:hypothetical protein